MTRHASDKMMNNNIPLEKILETLEHGIESEEKRAGEVYEFIKGFKNEVIKVVVADARDNWRIITVIKFKR